MNLLLEQQAISIIQDAQIKALKSAVASLARKLKVKTSDGKTIEDYMRNFEDEEVDRALAGVADDDPRHASILRKIIKKRKRP
jgi:rubrerythrin